ncbi:MAG: FAD-dependent oxidoreductase, partial [Chloroflexota bacterium]
MTAGGSDVVIIGGGIVGTAAAAFLADAGASVTLVERDGLASGASGANSGVVQHPFDRVLAGLYRETVELYRDLTDTDVGFRLGDEPAGLLYVSADEAAVRHVDRSLAEAFPALERIVAGGSALQAIEPAVAPDLWGCRVAIGYPVAPAASTYAYATI